MDTTPPQAPPALVSSTQQEAVDGLARLADTLAWIQSQQETLPALPAQATPEMLEPWLAQLGAWWSHPIEPAPGAMLSSRVDVLATRLAGVMRDDAIVRGIDGTLEARAAGMAARFARSAPGALPPGMDARALTIGLADYAGAVVVLDSNEPTLALLFMPDRGWEAFDGLEQLHRQTEARLRLVLGSGRRLSGVTVDDVERVVADERFVDSRPLGQAAFQGLAERIAALQKERVRQAWGAADTGTTTSTFIDEASAALDLHGVADIAALLSAREERLAASANEARLAGVSIDVAATWHDAAAGYFLAELEAATAARAHPDGAPLTLAQFSHRELTSALARRQFAIDPDDIQIEASGTESIDLPSLGGAVSTPPVATMSLAAFALHNTGWFDARRFRIIGGTAASGAAGPSVPALIAIVRELNLAARYEGYLQDTLSDTRGSPFREAAMHLQAARMRMSAADALVASRVRGETPVFAPSSEDRGFHLVETVLDAPAPALRRTVGGHRIAVNQLVYDGNVLTDLLVIGVKDARSSPRIVLYTPGAPDGREFHEFSDRATAAREFLYSPTFESYLLDHLPAEYAERIPNGHGQRRFRIAEGYRRVQWALASPGGGSGTIPAAAFEERLVEGNFFNALFHAELVRQAKDVAWAGRSNSQADWDGVMHLLGLASRGFQGPATVVEDTVGAVGQALRATWRFYDSVKAGDSGQAFVDFTEAYTSALSVAGWRVGAGRWAAPGSATATGPKLARARGWLEPRYATRAVDLQGSQPDAQGIYRLAGRRFIRQQDLVFELRRDTQRETWRLARPNALDAAHPGPAVERVASGAWRVRTDLGLRAGGTDSASFPQPINRLVDGRDLNGMTDFQKWSFQQNLARNLRHAGEANRLYFQTSFPAPHGVPVTLRQETAWGSALRSARNTPTDVLPLNAQPGPNAGWRVLPVAEWPASLWHAQNRPGLPMRINGSTALPLEAQPGSGLNGVLATSLRPTGAVPFAVGPTMPVPEWIQVHLHRYRQQMATGARPAIRVVEVQREPIPTYVIQPELPPAPAALALQPGDYTPSRVPTPPPSP